MKIKFRLFSVKHYRTLLTTATSILAPKTAVTLSYKIVGIGTSGVDSPPIFLIHAILGNKKLWKGTAKTITHLMKRTVISVDMRNHGASPHINSNRYDEMAADLIQLLDKLQVEKASLVGYDIGGRMAMCTALQAPKRVSDLVVVDVSPVSTSEHMMNTVKVLKAMTKVDFKNAKKVYKAKKEAKRQLKQILEDIDDAMMYRILANVKIKQDGVIGWGCNLHALIKYYNQLMVLPESVTKKKYYGPCLFIGGQLSEYLPADDLTKIREIFPSAVVRYIAKTTHNLHLEDPRSFLELVIAFLDTNY